MKKKMKKTINSKSFFGYKTKEKRQNEKIGYAISRYSHSKQRE